MTCPDGKDRWIVGFNPKYPNATISKHSEKAVGDMLKAAGVTAGQVKSF